MANLSKASNMYKIYFSCTTLLALLKFAVRFLSQPAVPVYSHAAGPRS